MPTSSDIQKFQLKPYDKRKIINELKGFRMLIMECKFQDVWKDEIGEWE